MKYLVVVGSPRKQGNTYSLASEFKRQVEEQGDKCDLVYVYNNRINPCVHCDYCKIYEGCCLNDDMSPILNRMDSYDVLIIASPLYFYYFTAPVKAFLDRLYSMRKDNLKLGAIIVSGSEFFDGGSDLAIETLRRSCNYCGMTWIGAVQKTTFDEPLPITQEDECNIAYLIDNAIEPKNIPYSVFVSN